MIVYTHDDCLKKFNGHNHPEKKERLELIKSQKENVELHRTIFEIVKDQKQLIDILSKRIDLLESRIKN